MTAPDHTAWPTTIEYATACAHWPQPGHGTHLRKRSSLAKARQAIIDSDHHAEMMAGLPGRHWYGGEAPHRLMVRAVTTWVDHDSAPKGVHPGQLTIEEEQEGP